MKLSKYIILSLTALTLLLNACNEEEFLERYPLDEISSAIYFKSASDFELYANQFYPGVFFNDDNGSTNNGWNGGIYDGDLNSDNMIKIGNPDGRLAGYNSVPSSGGTWEWDYTQIRSINYGIDNIDKLDGNTSEANQYIGELYFFRAFYFFDLVKTFGAATWIDKPLDPGSEELFAGRDSRTVIVNHILEDLDKAADLMISGKNLGGTRLSKEIAYAFKSRVALYEGTWEKYHAGGVFKGDTDGTSFLQQAEMAAKEVMNSGIYSIYSTGNYEEDYYGLFVQQDLASVDEVMLWKKYDINQSFVSHHHVSSRYAYQKGPTRGLAASYLSLDGQPRSLSPIFDENLCDTTATYESRHLDPRFKQTFASRDAVWGVRQADGQTIVTYWYDPDEGVHSKMRCVPAIIGAAEGRGNTPTGYIRRKGFSSDMSVWEDWADEDFAFTFIRYAEVLLNYAEAKAELGTLSQSDLDMSINKLRERVNMPYLTTSIANDPNWDFPGLAPEINEVRRERRVEMAFEGFRLDDILRWAAADELVTGKRFKGVLYNDGSSDIHVDENGYVDRLAEELPSGYGFDLGRDYLEAIPNRELTLNENLTQNPGW